MRTLRTPFLCSSFLRCAFFSFSRKKANIARCLLLFSMFYFCVGWLAALDPTRHISQYGHTAWRVQDGTVDVAGQITQTADGYLWLGTSNGLQRFDGVKFVRYAPPGLNLPTRNFTFLRGARDGSLWIGMARGLLRLKNEKLQSYTGPNETSGINSILEDDEGTIWVTRYRLHSGEGPLCRVEGNGLHCFGKEDGIPVRYGLGLTKDRSGNIWFGSEGLCRWSHGTVTTYFENLRNRQDAGNGVLEAAVGASGEAWAVIDGVGPDLGIRHFSGGTWTPYIVPGLDGPRVAAQTIFIDRNQSLWIGTNNKGLYRVHDGIADHYGSSDGLSGDSVNHFYEDHEGNIWVVTDGGLDIFRDTAVVSYWSPQGLSGSTYSILALRDDSVWIGEGSAVDILKGSHLSVLPGKDLSGSNVASLFQDHRGVVWVGAGGKLMTYERGRFEKVLTTEGNFSAIVEDTNQNIWALAATYGLFRINGRIAQKILPEKRGSRWTGLLPDPAGGIWIVAGNGDLTHFADGNARTVALDQSDGSLAVLGMVADSDGSVLEYTTNGLFRWDNRGWKVLDNRNGLPCNVIYSALKGGDGSLWLYAQCGLIKLERLEVEKWYQRSDSKLAIEVFDKFDGAHPDSVFYRSQPTASKTSDGRLWFVNNAVAQTIDPKQVYKNLTPPPVYVEKIVADRKDFASENGLRLPALSRDVEIDYTALSFVVPQKVRFRYKLEGRDTSWQEPETRRQAFYNDLRPGHYRFHVIACNNSGVWNEEGASLDFSIAPAWYQSNWFRAACGATFLLLLWLVYQLRLRQLRHQFSIGLEARVNERTRIARDLHDTLLQSFHGLLLRFQTVYALLPSRPEEAKQSLGSVIDQAAQAITESRDAVQGLRSSTTESNNLAVAIRSFGEELSSDETNRNSAVFQVQVEGTPRNLNPILRDEVYRIACEALRNSFQHAQAKHIEVEIHYDPGQIRLRVRDDGKGIDPKVLAGDGRQGHYGLHGMRERAEVVGGKLTVWSDLDSGTEVELSIPAAAAYATSPSRSWLFGKSSGRASQTEKES
jgi:signal transduction histidine kinase/ligand-binding sensor domain-containing protein